MSRTRTIVTRNAAELAKALGLSESDGVEMEVRQQLNDQLVRAANESGLTHAQIAKAAGTSRTRVTAILNRDRRHVSTDLMLRILGALGYETKMTFRRVRRAA